MNTDYHNSNFLNDSNYEYMNSYSAVVIKSGIRSSDTLKPRKHFSKSNLWPFDTISTATRCVRIGAILLTSKVHSLSCQALHFATCKQKIFVRHTRLNDGIHLQEFTESSSNLILSDLIKSLSSL